MGAVQVLCGCVCMCRFMLCRGGRFGVWGILHGLAGNIFGELL